MSRGRIIKREGAVEDLFDQAEHIARDRLEIGEQFLSEAEETMKMLARMPAMGTPAGFSNPLLA